MKSEENELITQEKYLWHRGEYFAYYENFLGQYIVKSIEENHQPGRLLDLGCGNGDITNVMTNFFESATGLDASIKNINIARKRYEDISFIHALAEDYRCERGFNTITMIKLLEHVQDPVELLKLMSYNLLPGGVIIAHVPNAVAVNRRISKLMGSLDDEYELSPFDINIAGHRRSYDKEKLCKDFELAGLKVLNFGGVFYKMLSTPQINWLLEKGSWDEGGFGWGRIGAEKEKDWRKAFCDACYEYGKEHPEDCNIIFVVAEVK